MPECPEKICMMPEYPIVKKKKPNARLELNMSDARISGGNAQCPGGKLPVARVPMTPWIDYLQLSQEICMQWHLSDTHFLSFHLCFIDSFISYHLLTLSFLSFHLLQVVYRRGERSIWGTVCGWLTVSAKLWGWLY